MSTEVRTFIETMTRSFAAALRAERPASPVVCSPQIAEIAAALAKAQGVMRAPGKNKTANVPLKDGRSYSYNYADLADVIDAIREPFAANGLSHIQIPVLTPVDGSAGVITRIMHTSGQWVESTLMLPVNDGKPQTLGSAITYARRYALAPMAGIASEDDEDGNLAQGREAETAHRDRAPKASKPAKPEKTAKEHPETVGPDTIYKRSDAQRRVVQQVFADVGVADKALMGAISKALEGRPMADLHDIINEHAQQEPGDASE